MSKIDTSISLFGKQLTQPIYLSVTGGKKCFIPNGEQETALAAKAANAMMITAGGARRHLSRREKGRRSGGSTPRPPSFGTRARWLRSPKSWKTRAAPASRSPSIFTWSPTASAACTTAWSAVGAKANGVPRDASGKLVYKPDDVLWTAGDPPSSQAFPHADLGHPAAAPGSQQNSRRGEGSADVGGHGTRVKHGISGVIVSNHGARQLDQVGSTIKALPECVQAAGGKIPVLVDGGFRRGTDVFKALALGASAVGVGRPYLWGLASFGQRGVEQVIKILQAELAIDMGMAGTGKVSEIDRSYVRIVRQ